jgi:hypothetical protein
MSSKNGSWALELSEKKPRVSKVMAHAVPPLTSDELIDFLLDGLSKLGKESIADVTVDMRAAEVASPFPEEKSLPVLNSDDAQWFRKQVSKSAQLRSSLPGSIGAMGTKISSPAATHVPQQSSRRSRLSGWVNWVFNFPIFFFFSNLHMYI